MGDEPPSMTPARSEAALARRSSARAPVLALVGDYSPAVPAHQAIPRAIELAGAALRGEAHPLIRAFVRAINSHAR
jgi:hypothetical protein